MFICRPIAIASMRPPPPVASSPDELRRKNRTPLGSQTIFPFSLESPASPDPGLAEMTDEEVTAGHPLTTVREISGTVCLLQILCEEVIRIKTCFIVAFR